MWRRFDRASADPAVIRTRPVANTTFTSWGFIGIAASFSILQYTAMD
jgi:hypothetical protein